MALAAYERLHPICRRRVRVTGEMTLVVFEMFVGALVASIGIAVIFMLGGIVLR